MIRSRLSAQRWRMMTVAAAIALVGSTVLTSCGGTSSGSAGAAGSSAALTTAAHASFDPPKTFGPQPVARVAIPDPQYWSKECTLGDRDLLCTSQRGTMSALDPVSGKPAWTITPTISSLESAPTADFGNLSAPVTQGTTAVGAFGGVIAAVGTSPARDAIEVVAADTTTGKKSWNTVIAIGAAPQDGQRLMSQIPYVTVIGVTDNAVVVTADSSYLAQRHTSTWVIDRATHQVRWQNDNFLAKYVGGDTVVGDGPGAPDELGAIGIARKGLALGDGHSLWSTEMGGDHTQYLTASTPNAMFVEYYKHFTVLDPKTGTTLYTIDDPNSDGLSKTWSCFYDNRRTVACQNKTQITGFDLDHPGTPIWNFQADGNRVPPAVTAAYHGVLYGLNTSNSPVMLDATTGKDLPGNPGIAPAMVNRFNGIVAVPVPDGVNETNGLVYQATS